MDSAKTDIRLIIENRRSVTLGGVDNVVGFDEDYVSLDTTLGRVIIEGEGMKIESLTREGGIIYVTGDISAVYYSEIKTKNGMFKRIFK